MKFAPALGLGALTFSGAAFAQDAPERRIDFGASAAATYESNFLKLPKEAVEPGEKRDEWRFNPAFTVDVQVPIGRQSLYLSGQAGYDFYARNEELDAERIDLRGGGIARLAGCTGDAGLGYGRQQSDLADILTAERIKNVEERWLVDVRVSCDLPNGLRSTFGYGRESVKNGDELRRAGNFSSDDFSASIGYARPWLGELGMNASYRKGRYDDRGTLIGAQDDLDTYTAGITFTRKAGSQLTGSGSLGYTRVDPKLPGVPGFKGSTWSLNLTWTPGTRLQAAIGTSRDVQQSNLLGISYAIVNDYRARVDYALGERVRLSLAGNHAKRSFRDSPLTPQGLLQDSDKSYRLLGSAVYTSSRRLSFSLDTSGEWRRSDNILLNYDNFLVALTARLTV